MSSESGSPKRTTAREEIEKRTKQLLLDCTLKLAQNKSMQNRHITPEGQQMIEYSCLTEALLDYVDVLEKRVVVLEAKSTPQTT